ncbi:Nif3-like dinuclear metal center hexameric protein [Ammoniphilus oxalaticus]|uniref:GTP cyclohydrolase 1 type 2 homolog n=1 Tax=Ammoniphilus oxalaticus TaxID=66863 RepID=A0A419SJD7_9BACL|nr:Nif3-like dinuclear metal center hexameric protein [Ammoniphilus oxalaticus]RKD24018.1 Nif3-like dinuclear metal center hexameric protein [Ammoniphilus oxalaticus]
MYANGQTIIQMLEAFAPKHLAVEGDRIGLQVGTLNKDVKKVMIALDVLEEVVDEAIEQGVDLIIAHHAVIFRPLTQLRTDLPAGKLYEKLIKHDIAVYITHTNLDVAVGGINDLMADALGLTQTEPLDNVYTEQLKKVVVFVPKTHKQQVLDAMGAAGAGWIGNYSHCSFQLEGVGAFMPRAGSQPYSGTQGKLEQVEEVRIETVITARIQNRVINSMVKAHPYEEVAYDIYPLEQPGQSFGLGRIGYLEQEMNLAEFTERVKRVFDVNGARVVGDLNKRIKKVAVLGGDGNRYVSKAIFKGADVLVTGDVYYHTAHDAMAAGLSLVDPGHNVEKIMKEKIQQLLQLNIKEQSKRTEVVVSRVNTDPFTFL